MNEIIPLIIYDINNQEVQHNFVSTGYTFFIRSYVDFDIRVLTGECIIFRVVHDADGKPVTDKSDRFMGDDATTSYTLFTKSDCVLQCGSSVYKCHLQIDNVFSEELDDNINNNYPNSHYNELLINYYLPTWEELEPAIFGDNKRELIKRMLIDFRCMLLKKGTLQSIEMFFKFVNLSGIKVYAEFAHENNDKTISKTIKPNTVTDWKTGDYHLLFDNWKQEDGNAGLNTKNLPVRKIHIEDLDLFFEKLIYAIALADKYFTLPEQEISFFGIRYSSNIMMLPSMRSNVSQIGFDDVHHFRKSININLLNYSSSTDSTKLVDDTIQITTDTYLSEVKIITRPDVDRSTTLFLIDKEIHDDESYGDSLDIYNSMFGNVLHLDIDSPNSYVEIHISSKYDADSFIHLEKVFVDQTTSVKFFTGNAGDFNIKISIWDVHNNREVYDYTYHVDENVMYIDFETFNSVVVTDEISNSVTLDISSPISLWKFEDFINYTLSQKDVPDDLSQYFDSTHQQIIPRNYIQSNKKFMLPEMNKNFILGDVTETLPLNLLESWVDVFSFRWDGLPLKLRVYDGNKSEWVLIDYKDISQYMSDVSDKIFVTILDINEPTEDQTGYVRNPYVFITTTEMGIDIKTMYDFVLVMSDGTIQSIYGLEESYLPSYRKLPINYDYELFIRQSILVPDFDHYLSGKVSEDTKIIVKSLFPRLINISLTDVQTYSVKCGDVVCCRTNKDYVTSETDISWEVRNAFTNEVMFRTTDEMLKYRIEDKTIYTLVVTYKIKGAVHTITKQSLFSSFETMNNF